MKKGSIAVALTAFAVLLIPYQGVSAPLLDQHQDAWGGGGMSYCAAVSPVAQIFTAGYSLRLDHVDVLMSAWSGQPTYPSTVEIRETIDNAPTGQVIGSFYAQNGFVNGWASIDFLASNIALAEGQRYAIVIWNTDPNPVIDAVNGVAVRWDPDSYGSGELWRGGMVMEGDMVFRTYVIPEPSSLLALLCGLAGVSGLVWRRKSL